MRIDFCRECGCDLPPSKMRGGYTKNGRICYGCKRHLESIKSERRLRDLPWYLKDKPKEGRQTDVRPMVFGDLFG